MSQLVLTSNTLAGTPASGIIEYNGQFYATDSAASRGQIQRITQGTVNAGGTTPFPSSGGPTTVDFTGIPAWAKKITVMFAGVSTNSTSNLLVQIGAGSVESTGYVSSSTTFTGTAGTTASSTAGFNINYDTASYLVSGVMVLTLIGSNLWSAAGSGKVATTACWVSGGDKTTSGTLDRVRITSVSANTFDAGSINIMYEG